ncbi:hypothetical protein HZQ56_17810 [Elizabethkingia anophelis]|nr:hypothetical protein [Elizabethkingia anophelis]MCT3817796.1 hypothetical protein [Elizabethkingia anophelis]MCT3874359.1 hypothetical protein [Elizabethkingia anophelis]MCT3875035.1 hypothetical protein [Elizabethkingia anophelis]
MKLFKSSKLYYAVFIVFTVFSIVMAIIQQTNDLKDYYTVVNIVYQDNTKDSYRCKGRPDVYLDKGELSVNGNVIKSFVKTFDWNVYKTHN